MWIIDNLFRLFYEMLKVYKKSKHLQAWQQLKAWDVSLPTQQSAGTAVSLGMPYMTLDWLTLLPL